MQRLTYADFIARVNELGFLTPSARRRMVPKEQYFSNDPDLDPWLWKDRAVREKALAYGSFYNGNKGYIAPRFYSIFVDAFHPRSSMEERYEAGKLGAYDWRFWNLLSREGRPLGTHEIRRLIGGSAKDGRSALDAAVVRLQLTFDVATTGNVDILDKNGHPYNQAVAYDRAENWVPPEWMRMNPPMEHEEALRAIYGQAERNGDIESPKTPFERSLKLYRSFL